MLKDPRVTIGKSSVAELASARQRRLLDAFHSFYYGEIYKVGDNGNYSAHKPVNDPCWLGTSCQKFPFDLLVFQEILWDTKPDLIIECGTCEGGTTVFLSSICELLRHGHIITIDLVRYAHASAPNVTWVNGSTLDEKVLTDLRPICGQFDKVMVILDDNHHADHVLKELDVYSMFVTKGCYLVVEDTNINGHPVFPEFGPGPWEAVHEWLPRRPEFVIDKNREHYGITYNPDGYLLRVK